MAQTSNDSQIYIREHLDTVMSNFDHEIDDDIAIELKSVPNTIAQYAGWNFCGYVYWDRATDEWVCEVWQYQSLRETVKAEVLEDIMDEVSSKYGWE